MPPHLLQVCQVYIGLWSFVSYSGLRGIITVTYTSTCCSWNRKVGKGPLLQAFINWSDTKKKALQKQNFMSTAAVRWNKCSRVERPYLFFDLFFSLLISFFHPQLSAARLVKNLLHITEINVWENEQKVLQGGTNPSLKNNCWYCSFRGLFHEFFTFSLPLLHLIISWRQTAHLECLDSRSLNILKWRKSQMFYTHQHQINIVPVLLKVAIPMHWNCKQVSSLKSNAWSGRKWLHKQM